MKTFDLTTYTRVLEIGPYRIYEHPKTFHHVMTYNRRLDGDRKEEQVTQWMMPGLSADAPVIVPPGFMQEVIKTGTKRTTARAEAVVDEPAAAPRQNWYGRLAAPPPAPRRRAPAPNPDWFVAANPWANPAAAPPQPAEAPAPVALNFDEFERELEPPLDE